MKPLKITFASFVHGAPVPGALAGMSTVSVEGSGAVRSIELNGYGLDITTNDGVRIIVPLSNVKSMKVSAEKAVSRNDAAA